MNSIMYGSAVVLCGIIAAFIVHEVFRWLQKRADLTESKLDDIVLYSLSKPLAIAIIAGSVWISVTFIIDPAALLGEYAWLVSEKCFAAAAILIAAWVVSSFVYNFINLYGRWMASQTETDLDDRIIRVLEVSARYVI